MTEAVAKANYKWRVVDIVVAAIIAVASGVIFWGWDIVCSAPLALFEGVTPGFEGLLNGFWLFAGPLAAIIVRKPGAALFAETGLRTFSWRPNGKIFVCSVLRNESVRWSCISPRR